MKRNWAYTLLVPGVTLITVFLLMPLLSTIFPTIFPSDSTGLNAYLSFFKNTYNMGVFARTVRIALITTLITVVIGMPVAYFISRIGKKAKGILIAITVFPLLTNSVVRSYAWMTILGKNGVINKLLMSVGLISEPFKMLYTEGAIIVGTVYLFLPLMVVSLVGVLENIGNDLLEAAESLGASKLKTFFKVVFPLSIPGLTVGSVLVFTGSLTTYTTPQLLGGNTNMVLSTLIYQKSMTLGDWSGASIVATIMIVTTLTVMFVINNLAKKVNKRGV